MKPIAIVTDYLGLIRAFRARVAELGISYETIDAIAGWTDGYAAKLFASEPRSDGKAKRALGPMSFDAALGALAVKLLVVPDPDMLRYIKRNRNFIMSNPRNPSRNPMLRSGKHHYVVQRKTVEHMRQMSRTGNLVRSKKLSPGRRRAIARKAAKARWSKHVDALQKNA